MRESAKVFKKKIGSKIIKVMEIGVCAGLNAKKLQDNFRISDFYLIDWYRDIYSPKVMEWLKSTHKLFNEDKRVTIIINNSLNVSHLFLHNSIDYIYLDGDHNPEHVYEEMKAYYPKVRKGGMLAGHDFDENKPDRVKLAVERFCKEQKIKYEWGMNDRQDVGDWFIWKT